MWTAIISALTGACGAALVLWLRTLFTAKPADVAGDRIETAEAQAEADRTKRLDEINAEADKIMANKDATAALDLLRRKFPPRNP
jgi:hypothetical protein